MENKDAAPPSTPFYNQSLDLPDWNEGLKVLSPNLPRHTPARTPWKMGPPQRTPQAKKPSVRPPALATSAQRLPCGPTPANTPVHGLNSASGMHARTPALSSFPNALTAEFWLTRAKAREDEGDVLGALGVLENAIRRNARPFSPLTKAIGRLQARVAESKGTAAARPTPVKLWSSLRLSAADKDKKKTLRFAGQPEEDIAKADHGQEQQVDDAAAEPKPHQPQDPETDKKKERTPHVRFCTPAPDTNRIQPKSPMHSRSSNAGSTPFHSSGSRQRMADFSDDSDDADISESGSPTTVSRRLLEPVLMETIRNMNAFKPSNNKEYYEAGLDNQAGEDGPAESHMSESDCISGMHRYLLESEVSPTSGAVKVPFKNANFYSNLADAATPHVVSASPLSEAGEVDEGRACEDKFSFDSLIPAATPDLNLQATPALRARPAVPPQGAATPSVCINPLYASINTPSTANSDAPNTAAYTPAAPADPIFYATPVTASISTAPLLSALAAKNLFSAAPVIEEAPEEAINQDSEPEQPAIRVEKDQPDAQDTSIDEALLQPATGQPTNAHMTTVQRQSSAQGHTGDAAVESGPEPNEDAGESAADAANMTEVSSEDPGSPVTQHAVLSQQEFAAARRAFPRTPASAVRRSRPEADDAPTPIRNPLRIATPARVRPRVGMSEMRSLLQDPHAPSPAQAAAMGSRNALSPMRARPRMHTSLGHAQLVTPKRRSARKPAAAAPQSTGGMLAAAGFAYTPNAALAGRLAAAADGRPVLGDAMDADLLASMDEVAEGEGSPVILDASQLEDLACAMGAVSLTPSLEAACHSRSNTPQPYQSSEIAATAVGASTDGPNADSETTPAATLAGPKSSMRVTRSALRKSQPLADGAEPAGPGGADAAEEGAESEQEGTPSFKEAPGRPKLARVTRSAAKTGQQTPAPAASAEASANKAAASAGQEASSNSSKKMSPTERNIRQGLRRSTRLA